MICMIPNCLWQPSADPSKHAVAFVLLFFDCHTSFGFFSEIHVQETSVEKQRFITYAHPCFFSFKFKEQKREVSAIPSPPCCTMATASGSLINLRDNSSAVFLCWRALPGTLLGAFHTSLMGLGMVADRRAAGAGCTFLSGSATLWLFMWALRDFTLLNTLQQTAAQTSANRNMTTAVKINAKVLTTTNHMQTLFTFWITK